MSRSTLAFAIVLGMGLTAATSFAQDATKPSVLLRTATILGYEAPNGPAQKPVGKNTGAGVMDVDPSFVKIPTATGFKVRVFSIVTVSAAQKNNNDSYMQGGLYIGDLTETGLATITPMKMFPTLQGERAFMRPQFRCGTTVKLCAAVMATEDNGQTNNPQPAIFVRDYDGNPVDITNSNRDNQDEPTNLITLAGKQDDQQWGPHSMEIVREEGNKIILGLGVQRNNQAAYVMRLEVTQEAGGARVEVPFLNRMVNDAQHCRPKFTAPIQGGEPNMAYLTSVEANNQPADIGIRLVKVNFETGERVATKLIAESDPDGEKNNGKPTYAVQNSTMVPLGNGLGAVQYQVSAKAGRKNGGNGHTGGEQFSWLATVKLSDLSVVQRISRVSPYQRHAFSFPTVFGEGAGVRGIASMGGSSTGTGRGLMQIISVDGAGTPTLNPGHLFEVSKYSDVANLPARGKRNPNNQGAGFLNGVGGVENPGYQKPNGFMPEVRSFFLSALPGYKEIPASNRESLWISLVPSTWDPAIIPVPGPVTQDIPPGPSPVVSGAPSTASAPNGGTTDPFGNPANGGGSLAGPELESKGCACTTVGTRAGSNLDNTMLLGLAIGAAFAARRRRPQ